MALKIQSFWKKKLTKDEIAKLCIVVSAHQLAADGSENDN